MSFTALLPLIGTLVGAGGALGGVYLGKWLEVRNDLRRQCLAAFLKLHAILRSVTEPWAPAIEKEWLDRYASAGVALEPIADELVALCALLISQEQAGRVDALRKEFRVWRAHAAISSHPDMPGPDRAEAHRVFVKEHPEKLRRILDDLTTDFRAVLQIPLTP